MDPPIFVAEYPTASYSSSGGSKTASVTTQAGDIVVVYGGSESQSAVDISSLSGNSISFTQHQRYNGAGNFGASFIYSGIDSTGGTGWTLTANATGSGNQWGFTCLVFRGSDGVGASNLASAASAAPSLNLTTTEDNSAIVVFNCDWNALSSARTWSTVNGVTPSVGNGLELTYEATGNYTAYGAYYDDAGTAGSKTVGLSAPGGQNYTIVALEVKGTTPVPEVDVALPWMGVPTTPTLRASSTNSSNNVSSLGVTIPASTQPGDLLVLTVAQTSFSATLFNAITDWTKQGEQRAAGAAHTIAVFTRVAQVGDAGTTVTSTSVNAENYTGQVRAYLGASSAVPLDAAVTLAEQDPAATSASAPAVTTTTEHTTIVTVYSIPTTTSVTLTAADWASTAGFRNEVASCTNAGTNNAALVTYDKTFPTIASQGPFGATVTDSRRWAMASIALRAVGAPLLYDTFSNAGVYSPQWSGSAGTISSGRLHLTTTELYDVVLTSTLQYDLTGRSLTVQAPVVPAEPSGESWLQIGPDQFNDNLAIGKGGDSMVLRLSRGGVLDDQYVDFNATAHAWWRIKLGTNGVLEWQTSPDGSAWTSLRTLTAGFTGLTTGFVFLYGGHFEVADADEPIDFDNISLV